MLNKILIWIAKLLIRYFLGSQDELQKELGVAVRRNREHREEYEALMTAQRQLETCVEAGEREVAGLGYELDLIDHKIQELQNEKDKKLAGYKDSLGSISDRDVIRADL